jgi:hypothetical protein
MHLRSEESGQDITDEATNAMHSEDVKSIVATEEVLQLGRVVASNSTNSAENNRCPSWNVARSWSNGDQASNNTGAETNRRPLAFQTIVNETPGDTANASSKVRAQGGHDRAQVRRKGRSCIEPEPSNPQENGTDNDVGYVVWAIVQLLGTVTATLAQHV